MEFQSQEQSESVRLIDPRYTEGNNLRTIIGIERRRNSCRHGIAAAARELFLNLGIASGDTSTPLSGTKPIISLGCGGCQVEQMVFGKNLIGLNAPFLGVDLEVQSSRIRRFSQSAEFKTGIDILDPDLAQTLPDGVILDIDTLSVIPPTEENLDQYIKLINSHIESGKGDLIIILTFPASADWWSPTLNKILIQPEKEDDLDINRLELDTGIYLLPRKDLQSVADTLLPQELLLEGHPETALSQILEHLDSLVHQFIVDGQEIWGFTFKSWNSIETIARESSYTVEELSTSLYKNLIFFDRSNPVWRINAVYAIIQNLFEIANKFEKHWIRQALLPEYRGKSMAAFSQAMGLATIRTFHTIFSAMQIAAFDAVITSKFEEAGLQVTRHQIISDPVQTTERSDRLPLIAREPNPLPTPKLITNTNKSYLRKADRIDWLLGDPLYSRQNVPVSSVVQRGRLVAYNVHK